MAIAETQDLVAVLRLDASQFYSGMAGVNRSLGLAAKGATSALNQLGRGVGNLGVGIKNVVERGLLILGGAMVIAGKQASDFEDAFAGVARTLSDNAAELSAAGGLGKIRTGLLELSRILPVTQTQLAGIAEVAGTAGIAAGDIVKFTEAIARLSKISDLNISEITPAIAKLLLVLKVGSSEINNFFSGLEQASIIGPSTDQEILLATERFASLGQQIGFTRDQLLALATISTSFGQRPEAAGTAVLLVMQRLSRTLATGGKSLQLLAEVSGKSAKEIRAEWENNPYQGLIDFLTGLQKLSPGQQAVVLKGLGLSTARIGQLLANLSANIPTLQKYTDAVTAADEEGTLFLELSDKRFTTTKNHLITLMNNVRDLGIAFGEGLGIDKATGALDRFISRIIDFVQKHRDDFVNLGQEVGKFLDRIDLDALAGNLEKIATSVRIFVDPLVALLKLAPPDWLILLAGLAGLNKLSGGFLARGVIDIGGSIATALGRILTTGRFSSAFVQPVFVTNQGFGGVGGGITIAGVSVAAIAAGVAALVLTQLPKLDPGPPTGNSGRDRLGLGNNPFSGFFPSFGPSQLQSTGFGHGSDVGLLTNAADAWKAALTDEQQANKELLFAANALGPAAGQLITAAGIITDAGRKFLDSLKPEHRRGEVGKSIQTTEGRKLLNLDVESPKFAAALQDLVDHYTKQPIGTPGHGRAFVLGNVNPIENRLGRELRAALKSGDGGRADDIVHFLQSLDSVPKNDLPPWIRRLVRQAERANTDANSKADRTRHAVNTLADRTSGALGEVKRAIAAKRLSVRVAGAHINVRPAAVHTGAVNVRVSVGTRTITRVVRTQTAYGPNLVFQQPGQIYEGPN